MSKIEEYKREPTAPPTKMEGPLSLSDFPEGKGKLARLNGLELAVFKPSGRLFALQNARPHEGASLADGELEGDFVICPAHSFRFNFRTGACSSAPDLRACTYPVAQRDGVLKLDQD